MKFDDLIETIDMLDAEQADEVIDWQMTKSPAAKVQHGEDGELERCRRDIQAALAEDCRQLMLREDWLIVNGPHGVRWSGVVRAPERAEDIQASLRIPPPPRITHVHEMQLGDSLYLLIDYPELSSWQPEEDITRVVPVPATTVSYRCCRNDLRGCAYHHRIAWQHPNGMSESLEVHVSEEMLFHRVSGLLGRKPIGGGWEAQLGINHGEVTAAVVSYER